MKIKKKNNLYQVESESHKGKFYTVDPVRKTCSCPGYIFYARKKGDICKHIRAVLEHIGRGKEEKEEKKKQTKTIIINKKEAVRTNQKHTAAKGYNEEDIIQYVKEKGEVDSIELLEKFGEERINMLINEGFLIEEHGRIKVVE